MEYIASKTAQSVLMVLVVSILSGCTHNTYDSVTIDEITVSYRTNLGTLPELSKQKQVTIIFESGLGDGLSSWDKVYNMLADSYHVFAYNRPGYEGSQNFRETDGKRTSDEIASRLHLLLRRLEIPRPFILVAHSAGSFYCLKFAELYPRKVRGIVLVDGRQKEFSHRCEAAGLSPCGPPEFLAHILPSHLEYEIKGLGESESLTPNPKRLPDIPITVIAATKPPPGAPKGGQEIWLEVQQEFAESIQQGRYIVAHGAGHYIHKDRPLLVTEEIKRLYQRLIKAE